MTDHDIRPIGIPKDTDDAEVFALVDFEARVQQQIFLTINDLEYTYNLIGAKLREKGVIMPNE